MRSNCNLDDRGGLTLDLLFAERFGRNPDAVGGVGDSSGIEFLSVANFSCDHFLNTSLMFFPAFFTFAEAWPAFPSATSLSSPVAFPTVSSIFPPTPRAVFGCFTGLAHRGRRTPPGVSYIRGFYEVCFGPRHERQVDTLRGPLHCCANTFRRAPTSLSIHSNGYSKSQPNSTIGPAKHSAGSPPPKPCNDYCQTQKSPSLQRPLESAVPLTGIEKSLSAINCDACGDVWLRCIDCGLSLVPSLW